MDPRKWKKEYIARLVERGLDMVSANRCFNGINLEDIDFDVDSPIDLADDELSYWANGG